MRSTREPGAGFKKEEIYEVWGDIVEDAAGDGPRVIQAIHSYLEDSYLSDYFQCEIVYTPGQREESRPFLTLELKEIKARVDVDARPFGDHLDVYGILVLQRGFTKAPDPMAHIADLEGWQRRDLQALQTLVKRAMEEALDALDEGRL